MPPIKEIEDTTDTTPEVEEQTSVVDSDVDEQEEMFDSAFDTLFSEADADEQPDPSDTDGELGDNEADGGAGEKPDSSKVEKVKEEPLKPEEGQEEEVVAAQPPEVPEQQPGMTPEQQAQQLAEFNKQAVDYLATNVYQLSEDEVTELETNIGEALPRLAANMHLQVMRAATNNVMRLLPQFMQTITQQQAKSQTFEQQFYETNPTLKSEQYKAQVLRIGQVYRQLNPQASNEDFIKDVGALAMRQLGLEATPPAAQVETPPPVRQKPHRPAQVGQPGGKLATQPTNTFEIFALEDLDDE